MDSAGHLQPDELLSHLGWMRRLAVALVGDGDDANDLTQEGLEAALRAPPLDDRPVRPWLAGVLRNLARMSFRGGARRRAREAAAVETLGAEPPSPEAMALEIQTQRRVAAHVLALEEPLRTTVLLRYYEGRTSAEIARLQAVPAGTVRRRLKTGLDQLRTALDEEHGGDRRRWQALLAPLVVRPRPAITGGIIMNTKLTLGAAAVVLAAIVLVLRWQGWGPWSGGDRARPGVARVGAPRATVRLAVRGGGVQVALAPAREPAGLLRLTGQVIDETEAPLEGALVAIDSSPPRTATTDVNGAFSFTALRPRLYRLEAQAGDRFAGPVRTRPSATGEPLVLRARPAAALEVEVAAASGGQPVAGAQVELRSTLVWRAQTDGQGRARLSGVGAGWYPLRVESAGFAPAAQMIIAAGGAEVQRVVVRLTAGVPVSGRVLTAAGAPVAGARVWPRSSSEPFPVVDPALDAVTTDGDGRFRLEALAPGSYQIAAAHPGHAPAATPPLAVAKSAVEGVELRMREGGTLLGDVRDPDGRPVAAVEVRAGALSRTLPWSDTRDAFTDAEGRFEITGLPRRSVQVLALAESGASPMSHVDLAATPSARVSLTLEVRGEIAGLVVDGRGQPVPEAQVTALPAGPGAPGPSLWDLRGFAAMVSDAGGRFRLAGLPDGDYQLRAARPGAAPDSARNQPSTPARPGDHAVKVVVRGDGTLVGRAQFEDGTAPASFLVTFGGVKAGPFTAPDGAFTITSPAGRREVALFGPSFLTTRVPGVELGEDARKDLGVVRLRRGRTVSGRVVRGDGTPVPDAQVVAALQLTGSGTKLYIPSESQGARETHTGPDGRFTVSGFEDRLPVVVVAEAEGAGRSAAVPIPPAPTPADVTLSLQATGSLEGRITHDGAPFPDTVVTATQEVGLANFFVTSGPDGRYALDTLTAGSYFLVAFSGRNKDQKMVPVQVVAGQRTHLDLDVRTGPVDLSVAVETDERRPVALANVVLVSGTFSIPEGTPMEVARTRLRPTEPTSMYFRVARGPTRVEGLHPGPYTICAVAARIDPADPRAAEAARVNPSDPLRCLQKQVGGSGAVVVTLPRSWTVPKG